MIRTFDNRAAFDAAAKDNFESSVDFIRSENVSEVTGNNVLVEVPERGDGVIIDENKKVRFVKADTFNSNSAPSSWQKVGVVQKREGKEVTILSLTATSPKFTEGALWYLTGINLGGGTITLQNRPTSGSATAITFTYGAQQSLEAFAQTLDTFLRANDPNAIDWHCEYMPDYKGGMAPVIIIDKWSADNQSSSPVSSGCTATLLPIGGSLPYYSTTPVKGDFGANYPSANSIVYDATTTKRRPTATEAWNNNPWNGPVYRSCFEDPTDAGYQYCQQLRDRYKTYDEYLESRMMIQAQRGTGGISPEQTLAWTNDLGARTHKKKDGSMVSTWPAFHTAFIKGFDIPELAQGKWTLPTVEQERNLMSDCTYCTNATWRTNSGGRLTDNRAKSDVINRTLFAMGGSAVNTAGGRWCGIRGASTGAWYWYGSYGYLDFGGRFFCTHSVQPVALFILP